MESAQSDKVVLGNLGAVYGIKGWLKVNSFTDVADGIFDYVPWLIGRNGQWQSAEVAQWRWHNKSLIVKLDGVDDRDEAARFTGCDIAVQATELPALPDDEFYWRDLIGLKVVNTEGYDMGVVTALLPTVSNDVLVVKANSNDGFGKTERLVPFIQSQYVKEVDSAAKQITVEWPADF